MRQSLPLMHFYSGKLLQFYSGVDSSSQKGSLRARIRTDYYLTNPHKVADRRKPAPMDGPTSR